MQCVSHCVINGYMLGDVPKRRRFPAVLLVILLVEGAKDLGKGKKEPVEVLCNEIESVKSFCHLGDRLNASGTCETAVALQVRKGWMKFRECGELFLGRRFLLRLKGMVMWKISNVIWK